MSQKPEDVLLKEIAERLYELCLRVQSKPYLLQKCQDACYHLKDVALSLRNEDLK